MDCLFCKIAQKEILAEIVYEDADTLAFLDIHPRAPGHTIIIPKLHAENLILLPQAAVLPTFLTLQRVTGMLKRALDPQGMTLGINQGEISGQTVPHLHIHIMPRFDGDGGGSVHSVVNNPPKESLSVIASKIRAGLFETIATSN